MLRPSPIAEQVQLEVPWYQCPVTLNDLVVPVYQRRVQYSLVKHIVTNFDPRKLQPLTVNHRPNGVASLIDGQQRREALLQLGHGERAVDCICYSGLTEEQEAFMYVATQETGARRILRPADQLKGLYYANDPEGLALTGVILDSGLDLDEHQPSRATNLQAVSSVRRILRRGGPDHLTRVLQLVQEAYPTDPELGITQDPNRGRLNGQILLGFSAFLLHYPEADPSRLVAQLKQAGLAELRQRSGDYRKVVHSSRWETATARAILYVYNNRRGGGQLPAWEVVNASAR